MNGARRGCGRALGILLGISSIVVAFSCSPPSAVYLCRGETGGWGRGRCPTLCESKCALADRAGCAPDDCLDQCTAREAQRTAACYDARYLHWRCLRRAGYPVVQCEAGQVRFSQPEGLCVEEGSNVETACREADAAPSDAADGDSADGDAAG